MFDSLFWCTGAAVYCCVAVLSALIAIYLLIDAVKSFAIAVDWHVWLFKRMSLNGRKPIWRNLPSSFWSIWLYEFFKTPTQNAPWESTEGEYRGFRDWEALKAGKQGEVITVNNEDLTNEPT